MNFVNLSDLYYAIAAQAPGLNEISAIDELRRAARTFARESMASQETIITAAAASSAVIVVDVPDAQVEPVGVLWIEGVASHRIHPVTLENIQSLDPLWRTRQPGTPTCFVMETIDEITLVPAPLDAIDTIYVRACYQPTMTASKIDAALVRHYEEGLIDGALYRILRMPNCSWSNPQAAQQAQERYETAISRARADAQKNHTINTTEPRRIRCLA